MKRILSIFLTVCMVLTLLPSGSMSYWCKHEYKADIHPAVCDRMGYTFYKCQLCGHEYYDDYVDAPGHPELVDGFCTQCNGYEAAVLNNGVYEIYNPGQLYWFAQQVNSVNMSFSGKLMNDIVINENVLTPDGQLNGDGSNFREWTPIGHGPMEYFGSFDGNGKTISGLYCNITDEDVGLFGWIGGGLVTNVGVVDSYIKGNHHVGAIAGTNHGVISNCYNTGVVYGTGSYVGGIVGESGFPDECAVINCYNTGNIYGHRSSIGGIVGHNSGGIVRQCYNTGDVTTGTALGEIESTEVGGIVGYKDHDEINGTIIDCFNTGTIIGNSNVGGIVGHGLNYLDGHNGHSIASYSHNVGTVSAVDGTAGAIIGYAENVTVDNSYYLSDCTSENNGFGTAKTADEFASGEVCQLLQLNHDKQIWVQNIGTDIYPVFGNEQANVYAYLYGTVTSYLYAEDITLELLKDGEVMYRTVVNGTTVDYRFDNVAVDQYILRISKGNHATQEIAISFDMNGRCLDVTIYPAGDVTGDGYVNIKDYQRLLRHVNKTAPLTDYALACGDVTGDGATNIKDFQRLLRHVNKTNPLFPNEDKPNVPPVTKDVSIKIWVEGEDITEENGWIQEIQRRFQQAHPEYNITWINEAMNSGDIYSALYRNPIGSADVFIYTSDNTYKLANSGVLSKITGDYVNQVILDNIDLNINSVTYQNGELYGFPISNYTFFMYYDKRVFSEEDVKSLDAMVNKGRVYLPVLNAWTGSSFFLGCGGTIFGENGRNELAGIDFSGDSGGYLAAEKMIELRMHPNVIMGDIDSKMLTNGDADAIFSGNWDYAQLKQALGDNLGIAMLPKFTIDNQEYQMTALSSSKAVGVNSNAAEKDICMEFAAFMASKESQLIRYEMSGIAPAHKDLIHNETITVDELAMAEMNTMHYASVLLPSIPGMVYFWTPMGNFVMQLSRGNITLENYKLAVDELNQYMNDPW